MAAYDNDNIPLLVDIIREPDEALPADTSPVKRKKKIMWDDNGPIIIDEEDDSSADDNASSAPVVSLDEQELSDALSDESNAEPADEPVALRPDEEPGITDTAPAAIDDDTLDVIDTEPEVFAHDTTPYQQADEAITPAAQSEPSPRAERIDIDALTDRIVRQLQPELESYLQDRIRRALETALDGTAQD